MSSAGGSRAGHGGATGHTEDTPLSRILPRHQAAALAQSKGLLTVGDLLEFVPRRYLPPNELTDLASLVPGEDVLVVAEVARTALHDLRRRRGYRFVAVLTDGHHELDLTFFPRHRMNFGLHPGVRGVFAGTVDRYGGRLQLTHPEMDLLDETLSAERVAFLASHQVPVYSRTGKITSFVVRRLVELALDSVDEIREPVPEDVRRRRALPGRRAALELVHRPPLDADVSPGLRRLRYDEAFVLQTILGRRRAAARAQAGIPRMPRPDGLLAAFDARLPFALTAGQREVGELLAAELAEPRPMHRLLQGEVGSGKTVVALRAMLAVVDAGGQCALLAPTEVLAAQHERSITALLGDLAHAGMLPLGGGIPVGGGVGGSAARPGEPGEVRGEAQPPPPATRVAVLTGSQPAAARRAALADIASGAAGIVVGTHALIQRHVRFADLALVVVDEQHRFGVHQRDALREKAAAPPHLLVMTATPIPRTVAMTVFGDMETATLTELPAGRQPIETHVVDAALPRWVERTWERIAEEVALGHQVYVVCPTIGAPAEGAALTSDSSDEDEGWERPWDEEGEPAPEARPLAGVYDVAERLRGEPALAQVRVDILHGRLDAETKDKVMTGFAEGRVDVLVATTIVEVGVDVPNASTMVVMDADRFGLSQLHQLRGRIGRGGTRGLCLLMTGSQQPAARDRLAVVAGTTDGFELARADLRLRREGDVLGSRQHGRGSSVRFLRMGNRDDEQLIAEAREDAFALLEEDPDLTAHPVLAARVAARVDEQQAAYLEKS